MSRDVTRGGEGIPQALALLGPTASGKTALSLALAPVLGAEVISLDSRQLYRGMDVGTAKVSLVDRARVPHFGLDVADPRESWSAGRYAREARRWMEGIRARGRIPLLVGGTGFFLRALTHPVFQEPELEPQRRRRLREFLAALDPELLARWVEHLDPERAPLAVAGGRQRISRTLEVALLTGRPLSWWHRTAPPEAPPVPVSVVLLEISPERLRERIGERVEVMVETGLLEEVERLLAGGVTPGDPGMTATGYREAVRHLRGELTREEMEAGIRAATWKYARRQRTWFRGQLAGEPVLRLDADLPVVEQAARVREWWGEPGEETMGGARWTTRFREAEGWPG